MRGNERKEKINRLKISHDIGQKLDISGIIFQFTAVFIGAYSMYSVFAEGLGLIYSRRLVVLAVIMAAVIYSAVFLLPDYIKYSFPAVLFITMLFLWKFRTYVIDGFYHVENAVIYILNSYFDAGLLKYVTEYEAELAVTAFLISAVQLIVVILAASIYYGMWKYAVYILSMLLLGVIFAIGNNPPEIQFLLLAAFLIYMFVSEFVPLQEMPAASEKVAGSLKARIYSQRRRTRSGAYGAVIFCALVVISMLIYPVRKHADLEDDRRETAADIRNRIEEIDVRAAWDTFSEKFIDTFFSDEKKLINITRDTGTVYYGGLSGGKLGKAGSVAFTNETALKLTLPYDTSAVYLKGFVGTEYTGDSWDALDSEMEERYQGLLKEYAGKYSAQKQMGSYYKRFIDNPAVIPDEEYLEYVMGFGLHKVKESRMVIDYVNADENYTFVPYAATEIKPNVVSMESDSYYKPSVASKVYYITYYDISIQEMAAAAGSKLKSRQNIPNTDSSEGDDTLEGDSTPEGNDAYEDEYLDFISDYNQYVRDAYLSVPNELTQLIKLAYDLDMSYMRNLASSALLISEDQVFTYRYMMANYVAEYMKRYTYTLSPGKIPNDSDYAEYFLFDNKQGYCTHFATAATLLLRCLGIPARYVEGYVITREDIASGIISGEEKSSVYTWITGDGEEIPSDDISERLTTVEIRDTNAHAWVEIYFDDYGWVPLEVTSGYTIDGSNIHQDIKSSIIDSPEPTRLPINSPTPTPGPTSSLELNNVQEEDEIDELIPPENKGNGNGNGSGGSQDEGPKGISYLIEIYKNLPQNFKLIIMAVLIFLVITSVFYVRYMFLKEKVRKRIMKGGRKKKVLGLYYEMERLFKWLYIRKLKEQTYMGFAKEATKYGQAPKNFERIMEIILKSRFSDEAVTEEELQEVFECYSHFRNIIYNRSGKQKRRWIKYFVVI